MSDSSVLVCLRWLVEWYQENFNSRADWKNGAARQAGIVHSEHCSDEERLHQGRE
jgi:hypothetical protein